MDHLQHVDELVRAYARFLSASWRVAAEIAGQTSTDDLLDDWKQANWERLVEAPLLRSGVFLQIYDEGADCYGNSSRIYRPEVTPTHRVVCCPLQDEGRDCLGGPSVRAPAGGFWIDRFVNVRDGWCFEEPPFEFVRLRLRDDHAVVVLDINEVRFELAPVGPEDW